MRAGRYLWAEWRKPAQAHTYAMDIGDWRGGQTLSGVKLMTDMPDTQLSCGERGSVNWICGSLWTHCSFFEEPFT
jgi:hypothetical protein